MTIDELREAWRANAKAVERFRQEIFRCRNNARIWEERGFGTVAPDPEGKRNGTSLASMSDRQAEHLEKALEVGIAQCERISKIANELLADANRREAS